MVQRSFLLVSLTIFTCIPSLSFSKDMTGTLVKCTPKTISEGGSIPKPVIAAEIPPYYIAIASKGRFCFSTNEAACSDVSKFEAFEGDAYGSKTTQDEYILNADLGFSVKINRDGSKYTILDFDLDEVIEGECELVKNL